MTGMEPSANHFERQQTIQKDTTGRAEKEDFLRERGRFSYHHRKSYYFSAAWAVGGDENETVLTYSPFAKGNIKSGCGSLWQFHYKFNFLSQIARFVIKFIYYAVVDYIQSSH